MIPYRDGWDLSRRLAEQRISRARWVLRIQVDSRTKKPRRKNEADLVRCTGSFEHTYDHLITCFPGVPRDRCSCLDGSQ